MITKLLFALTAGLLAAAPVHSSAADEPIRKGDILVVALRSEINQPLVLFLRRAVKTAESGGASALVLDMNTFGGRLDSAEEITGILNRATIPTYTLINTNAGSAGALIALATKHIYMTPVSAIGAAAPVLATGEDLHATERDKTVSYWSALTRASALRNGHNPDLGEAFINKEKEVKIGDRVVHQKGTLLTLTADEAIEQIGGKPLLAEGVADSIAELAKKAKLTGRAVAFAPTGFEQLAFWITALAPLLLLGGILGAYLEFKIPGASLPGVLAAICFALFFLGHYLAGLAGWEVVALFVAGVVLVIVEVLFFAHSTIVVGLAGVFMILGAILWAMIDRYPGQPLFPTGRMLRIPVLNLLGAMVAAILAIMILARYLPRTSIYRRFVLTADIPSGPSLASPPRHFAAPFAVSPGSAGIALTTLRPSGKARFGEHVLDVVTDGEFVAAQTAVAVVSSDGMRVVVKATG